MVTRNLNIFVILSLPIVTTAGFSGCGSSGSPPASQGQVAQEGCPNLSGKYECMGPQLVEQTGCSRIHIRSLQPAPDQGTTELKLAVDGVWVPKVGNDTWVESAVWKENSLIFTSRYSDSYLASGVQIGDNIETKRIYQFSLQANGNVLLVYSLYGAKGQEVQKSEWYSKEFQKLP